MTTYDSTVRRWGTSLATVIPPEVLAKENLKPGDPIEVKVRRRGGLEDLFGKFPGLVNDLQEMRDEERKLERERERPLPKLRGGKPR